MELIAEEGSLAPNQEDQVRSSVESDSQQCSERENSLEFADELTDKGKKAVKDCDYAEASDFFSRALEIRAAHHGELSAHCIDSYYRYGCALLYKAQEEADPLVSMPKKDAQPQQSSTKDVGSVKNVVDGESSTALASGDGVKLGISSVQPQNEEDNGEKAEEDENEESDPDDDEDESDLDLAWKMLDIARAIAEKNPVDSMEKVDILSSLAEVALEREDIQTSLEDYLKALSILEGIVETDSRHIAEINFRICLCLEIGSKAQEAIPYCEKAVSICKSRLQRLMDESKTVSTPTSDDDVPELDGSATSNKQEEIDTLRSLSIDLEKKLEDLQQVVTFPTMALPDILRLISSKEKEKSGCEVDNSALSTASSSRIDAAGTSSGGFDTPTANTNETTEVVTHLGVVGRGVKRVGTASVSVESFSVTKKQAIAPDGN